MIDAVALGELSGPRDREWMEIYETSDLASGSALLMPAAPLARAAAHVTRVPSPAMELHRKGHVVRIEVELEQGEPCVPLPPRLGT